MTQKYLKLIFGVLLAIAFVSLAILSFNFEEENLRIFIAWSAKLAAGFFSLAFVASAVHGIFQSDFSARWLKWRPQLGLVFACFHTTHLVFLILLQSCFHPVFEKAAISSLVGGTMAYVFMYLMTITSFPEFKNRISTMQWKLLHTIGGYWIWFIFFRSYYRNVTVKGEEYVMFFLLASVLILRMLNLIKKKTQ